MCLILSSQKSIIMAQMATTDTKQQILTMRELAAKLRCSRGTAHTLITNGAFPNAFQLGNRWRIPAEDVAAYKQKNKVRPVSKSA